MDVLWFIGYGEMTILIENNNFFIKMKDFIDH